MGLANLFSTILDIEPRLFQPIEQKSGVGLHGLFRLVDSRRGAVISPPTHPLRLCYVISDPALSPELASQLECAPQGPIMSGFALAGIGEPVGPARREGEGAVGQVEFRRPRARAGAYEPPPSAAEGLQGCFELDPVIGTVLFSTLPGRGVMQSDPAIVLTEMGFVAER